MKLINENKSGFTLVELLSVLFLLGLIALITISTIDLQKKYANQEMYKTQIKNIELSAKSWGIENPNLLPKDESEIIIITLGQLKEAGIVDEKIKNPLTKKIFSNDLKIKIIKTGKIYKYEVIEE